MGPFRRLFGYVGRCRRAFLQGIAFTILSQAVTLASPKILQYAIDDLTRGAIHRRFEQIQAQLATLSAIAQEALSGVRLVRAYRQEAAEIRRFRDANEEYVRRSRRLIALQGFFIPSMSFFLGLSAIIVVWLG